MKLLTAYLSNTVRSAVRFVIVGVSGMGIQYAIYFAFLKLFEAVLADPHVSLSFTLGFVLEMITNYFLQTYYVFESKPNWKNAGGFVFSRTLNYGVQMAFLWLIMWMGLNEYWAGILSINLAGIVNYFVLKLFYRKQRP